MKIVQATLALLFVLGLSPTGSLKLKIGLSLGYDPAIGDKEQIDNIMAVMLLKDLLNQKRDLIGPNVALEVVYLNSRMNNAIAINNALNFTQQQGILAVIGAGWSRMSIPTSLVLQNYMIPQCCGSSTNPDLGQKLTHPYFFRTIPADESQAEAIISYISSQGWKRIGIVHTSEEYGRGLATYLNQYARLVGIEIAVQTSLYVEGDETEAMQVAQNILTSETRVFVMASFLIPFQRLLKVGKGLGIFGVGYVWICAESLKIPDKDPSLSGIIYSYPVEGQGLAAEEFKQYYKANRLSADFDFASLSSTNEPGAYSYYTATCLELFVLGFDKLLKSNSSFTVDSLLSGNLKSKVSIPGTFSFPDYPSLTGKVEFDENGNRKGITTLILGIYEIFNYNADGVAQKIGTIDAGRYTPVPSITVQYLGNTEKRPKDRFDPSEVALYPAPGSSENTLLVVLFAICTCIILVGLIFTYFYRNAEAVKRSSFLLSMILQGTLWMGSFQFLIMTDLPTSQKCSLDIFLLPFVFGVYFCSVCLKTYRIAKAFQMKVPRLFHLIKKDQSLFGFAILTSAPLLLISTCWLLFDAPKPTIIESSKSTYYWSCRSTHATNQSTFLGLIIGYCAVILMANLYMAFQARNLQSKFNETKMISLSVYNMTLLGCFAIPVLTTPSLGFSFKFYFKSFCLFYIILFNFVGSFGMKLVKAQTNDRMNRNSSSKSVSGTDISPQPLEKSKPTSFVTIKPKGYFTSARRARLQFQSTGQVLISKCMLQSAESNKVEIHPLGRSWQLENLKCCEVTPIPKDNLRFGLKLNNQSFDLLFDLPDHKEYWEQYFYYWKWTCTNGSAITNSAV
jgi:ABC-type branched-subunit amino acid transport system substrate-binding protein